MPNLLYLSHRDVASLGIRSSDLTSALARAFRLHACGATNVNPKQTLGLKPGLFFQSLSAGSSTIGYVSNKWVGVSAENPSRQLPGVNGLVILSEAETGLPIAILDGNSLTVMRTAAMSALAASYLARPDSRSIGFVGCGKQAEGHLSAFLGLMPALQQAVCVAAGRASAERLAAAARERGVAAIASNDPDAALACDIVITSVSPSPDLQPFLDAASLAPGSFVSAVDLGASWRPETLAALDIMTTDDRIQADIPSTRGRLAFAGRFDADLAEMVTQSTPLRTSPDQRAMFLFPGFALADLAVAALVFEAATRQGVGSALPR